MICVRNRSHRNDQCKHARQRDRDPIHDFPFPSSSLRFRSLQDSQPHMLEPHRNGRTNGRIAFVEPSTKPESQRFCAARRVIRRNRRPFETTPSSHRHQPRPWSLREPTQRTRWSQSKQLVEATGKVKIHTSNLAARQRRYHTTHADVVMTFRKVDITPEQLLQVIHELLSQTAKKSA